MDYMKAINAMTGGAEQEYIDITDVKPNNKVYGGLSCTKIGITLDGVDYVVKFPGRTNGRNLSNVTLTYSNNSVTEYLGSKIFGLYGMDVHDVNLAKRNGKVCVMCKDFVKDGRLVEFREIKQSYEPGFFTVDGNSYDGKQTELVEVLEVISCHHLLKDLPYREFFWKMFIIDAIIGNHDRNLGNFGIIESADKRISIAPVYDNGNSFNPTWDDAKMMQALESEDTMKTIAYNGYTCNFTHCGKKINPFQYIEKNDSKSLGLALEYVFSCNSVSTITDWIKSQVCIGDIQKQFYCKLIELRLGKLHSLI